MPVFFLRMHASNAARADEPSHVRMPRSLSDGTAVTAVLPSDAEGVPARLPQSARQPRTIFVQRVKLCGDRLEDVDRRPNIIFNIVYINLLTL